MHAVIMAGGKGTRFWPRSRERMPKHLLNIISAKTIIRETVERLIPFIPPKNILIVTGQSHADELISQLPEIPEENIIIEPTGRNTAPCIGLAALHVEKETANDVMIVLPADHFIADKDRFLHTLAAAVETARQGDHIITIGIEPTAPETGYGYIEQGSLKTTVRGEDIYEVRSIREKPASEQARQFLQQGGFSWNSGIFIGNVSTMLCALKQWLPALYEGLCEIKNALGTDREKSAVDRVYRRTEPVSFDYGVMEKADNALIIRGDFGWCDVGSWDALWEISQKDTAGNAVTGTGTFVGLGAENSLVYSPRKLVALVGVTDLIVVETEDALLICRRGASQDVKNVVEKLESKNMKAYL
ncbi:MAG: mannose-1-phosphate guanylyltransferase [Deltaproteobacteria bacterium]|nr:mannose-1-phosphate guanylyltransferase [Deltaproteobacteria bacterium]